MLLHHLVERHVQIRPDSIAVTASDRSLTYAELWAEAGAVAAALSGHGVGPEDMVAVCCERGSLLVVALLGVSRAGAAAVPLDLAHPTPRLARVALDARVRAVLHSGPEGVEVASQADAVAISVPAETPAPGTRNNSVIARPENAAYVVFTSGSTGEPKGVVVEHRQAVSLFRACATPIETSNEDVWACVHSPSFDLNVWEVWGCLGSGGRLVVVPHEVAQSFPDLAMLVSRERVTVLTQTPSALSGLAHGMLERGLRGQDLALRHIVLAGEAVRPNELVQWFDELAPDHALVHNLYGITETTIHVTHRLLTREEVAAGLSPVGPALDGYAYTVVPPNDSLCGRTHDRGQVDGELYVSGVGVARGYLGRPGLTAERFLPDPNGTGTRCYRSGDRVRVGADSDLHYVGRLDRQVKLRGHRIELGEIESALRALPQVIEGHVAMMNRDEDPANARLVAFVRQGQPAARADEIQRRLRDALPAHMVPQDVVVVDRMPLTTHGKIDLAALRTTWEARRREAAEFSRADLTPEEAALAEAWAEVLGLDEVSPADRFFAIGGNSLLSVRVTGLLRQRGWQLEVGDLLREQRLSVVASRLTPAEPAISEHTEVEQSRPGDLLPPAAAEWLQSRPDIVDAYPLTSLQLGMIAESARATGPEPYHLVARIDMTSSDGLDNGSWQRIWRAVLARHEVLRTSFELFALGEPAQVVHAEVAPPVTYQDLAALPAAVQDERIAATCRELDGASFDVRRSDRPLWRAVVVRRASTQWTVLFAHHHAIIDGWSTATLLRELQDRLMGDNPDTETPPPLFRDYVRAEIEAGRDAGAARYWQNRLAGAGTAELRWVRGEPDTGLPSGEYSLADVHAQAIVLAGDLGVPLKSVFLAATAAAVCELEGRSVVIGLLSNGRLERSSTTEAVGLFLNTVPLVLDEPLGTWSDLVRYVWAEEREAFGYRHFPAAAISRATGRKPAPVMFTYNDFSGAGFVAYRSQVQETGHSSVPLTVVVVDDVCLVDGSPEHVSSEDCQRLAERIHAMMVAIVADPGQSVSGLVDGGAAVLPSPDPETPAALAPGLETTLAETWSHFLGKPVHSRTANFFELGGDSIMAIKLVSRLSADLGVALDLAPVFETADLGEMADEIQALLGREQQYGSRR